MKRLITLLILISCGNNLQIEAPQPSISNLFKDSQGKCLGNIGHRLGGDFREYKDNTLVGLEAISRLQDEDCFSHFEFDIMSALDYPVIFHDKKLNGVPLKNYTSNQFLRLDTLMDTFESLDIYKRVHFDLKKVSDIDLVLVKYYLLRMYNYGVDVRMVTSRKNRKRYRVFSDHLETYGIETRYY
jgi:hypothetical protein